MLDALKSGRQSCYLVAMIVARLVIRYSANIYLAAICMRPNSRDPLKVDISYNNCNCIHDDAMYGLIMYSFMNTLCAV